LAHKSPIGRTVGSLLPQVTKKALEKFGFPAAAVLTDWPGIVGADIASYTAPERLRWPRHNESEDRSVSDGATLLVRVEGPRALELQHQIPQLIERINSHFGFRAITEIRFLQAPLCSRPLETKPCPLDPNSRVTIAAAEVQDERLRDVLERLGAQVSHNLPEKSGT
jgi:hypothetical protein